MVLLAAAGTGYTQTADQEWPVFRGRPDLTGNTNIELPSSPSTDMEPSHSEQDEIITRCKRRHDFFWKR